MIGDCVLKSSSVRVGVLQKSVPLGTPYSNNISTLYHTIFTMLNFNLLNKFYLTKVYRKVHLISYITL